MKVLIMNENVNQIIGNYLNTPNATDYAIMINGSWGCGKTYYLENELKDNIKKSDLKYIYTSLSGYSNFKNLSARILYHLLITEKNENFDEELVDNLWDLDTRLSNLHPAFYLVGILKDQVKKVVEKKQTQKINTSKIVIIFDDLERVSDDILRNDLILLVYEKYVKKGYKVLFVGDETNIKDENYDLIKEKVIRRTISYEPDRNQQFANFIESKYSNLDNKVKELFTQRYINYFIELGLFNFRTVAFIIDSYLFVLDNLEDHFRKQYNEFFFKNILILTNEYKNGKISISNTMNYSELARLKFAYLTDYIKKTTSNDVIEEPSYINEFREKYTNNEKFHDFCFFTEIYDYILTGYLNKESLNKSIKNTFVDIPDDQSVFSRLTKYWYNLEENQLKEDIEKMIRYTENGKYSLFNLPYIYTFFIYIKDRKYLTDWCYDIEKVILNSIKYYTIHQDLIPERIDLIDYQYKYDEKRPTDAFYHGIIDTIKMLSLKKQAEERKKVINDIYEILLTGNNPFELLYNNYSFFYDTVMSKFEIRLLLFPNSSIRVVQDYVHSKLIMCNNPGSMNLNEITPLKAIVKKLPLLIYEKSQII